MIAAALLLAATTIAGPASASMGGHPAQPASRILPELPVMPGLWESGSGYVFPMAAGARLAETRLLGRTPDVQVRAFYARMLPRIGWRQQAGAPWLYRRGRERLVLHVGTHRAGGGVLAEALFVVTPDGAPAPRHSR